MVASPAFATAVRLRAFLRYVVERSLAGEAAALKEYAIGVDVFERDDKYDPRLDTMLRVAAGRLRAKLEEYYGREGAADPVIITIARGSFMNELVEIAGGANVYADMDEPSPAVSIEDVIKRDPQFILAGPDGAKKIGSDPQWSSVPAVRKNGILIVDTAVVARPSVKLGEAAVSLAQLLHPGVVSR
jgi:hypothetical protein